MDIPAVMQELSKKRSIFHSESDFKFALAWEIQSQYSKAKIRPEYPYPGKQKAFCDIFVELDNRRYIIELKYMKATIEVRVNDEEFKIKYPDENQNCRDGFYRDIQWIEKAVREGNIEYGYAILLTNYQPYWDKDAKSNGYKGPKINWDKYPGFNVCEDAIITGDNEWHASAKDLRKRGPVVFNREYTVKWQDYSKIKTQDCINPSINCSFRYALISVLA